MNQRISSLLIFTMLVLGHSASLALPEVSVDGEMSIISELNFLPTSVQGNTAFRLQNLQLNADLPLKDANNVHIQFEGAENRAVGGSNRFDMQLKEAYLDLVSPFEGLRILRYGLAPNSWQENQRENWDYQFLGTLGESLTEKNAYISYADLGAQFSTAFYEDKGEFTFSITNGEGLESDEVGPRKDAQLLLNWNGWGPVALSLGYIFGSYDRFDPVLGKKERILMQAQYQHENGALLGVELMDAHDPADTFAPLKMAQGVDLSNYSGTSVHGMGGVIFLRWNSGPKAQTVLRYEELQVVVGNPDKRMRTAWGGLDYQFKEDINAMLAYNYSWFPERYGLGSRDQSALKLATQVSF